MPFRARLLAPRQPPLKPLHGSRALLGIALCVGLPVAVAKAAHAIAAAHGHPLLVVSASTSVVMLAYLVLVKIREWRAVLELGVRPMPRELGIGLALGAVACMAIVAGSLALQAWQGGAPAASDDVLLEGALRAFVLSRQSAVIEEIVFRGLLLRWLWGRLGVDRAVLLQALVFGAAHYPQGGAPQVVLATVMGLVLGYAFLWRRSLWTPIGVHFAWDVLALLSGTSAPSGTDTLVVYAWLIVVALGLAWPLRRWALEWGTDPRAQLSAAGPVVSR